MLHLLLAQVCSHLMSLANLLWLLLGVSQVAQSIGWESLNMQLSAGARSTEASQASVMLSRRLAIAGQFYQLCIIPQDTDERTIWRFKLRNAVGAVILGGFKRGFHLNRVCRVS